MAKATKECSERGNDDVHVVQDGTCDAFCLIELALAGPHWTAVKAWYLVEKDVQGIEEGTVALLNGGGLYQDQDSYIRNAAQDRSSDMR